MGPGHHAHLNVPLGQAGSSLSALALGSRAPTRRWGDTFKKQLWEKELSYQKYENMKLTNQKYKK